MNSRPNDIPGNGTDTRSLANLIVDLNIARRNCRAYPKGHPIIAASLAKVLIVYEELLKNNEELILGITSDALMVDGTILEKTNQVYRDFSRALFERGIGAVTFHRGLTVGELANFTTILGLKREQIFQHGGIEQIWFKSGITAITIRPIRYDLFQASEDGSVTSDLAILSGEGLWEQFARELTLGELIHGGSSGNFLDPEILAEILNRQFANGTISETEIRKAVNDFLAPAGTGSHNETLSGQPYQKLAAFFSNLTPKLRRQFLDSSFGSKNHDRQAAAERILTNLSDSAILETIEDINHNRLNVSPVVFGLLQRLGQNADASLNVYEDSSEDDNLTSKMKTIFREHDSEEFVPDDYQRKLNLFIASDQISGQNMEEVTELLKTVESRSIEGSVGQILINLIRYGGETPEERKLLLQNLSDMFGFFLETGDYGQLHSMMDQVADGTFSAEIQHLLLDEYSRRENLEEILDGLTTWGKPRYNDIRSLIHKIGGNFVEAILDRLSEEQNMSLRRFYIDCLTEMGPIAQAQTLTRLSDKRWYFLRNLLVVLTAQNDPSVVTHIRHLLRNPDPRLHHEVLKALVHFQDPQAEKKVLEDLESKNQDQQTAAIQLAERCKSPAIVSRLSSMLSHGGFSQVECERKSSIVHALGEIGRAEVLPELAKILSSRSLLHSRQLTKLKTDIIHSLPKYPPNVSRPVLEHIAKGSGEVANLAAETMRIISGKSS